MAPNFRVHFVPKVETLNELKPESPKAAPVSSYGLGSFLCVGVEGIAARFEVRFDTTREKRLVVGFGSPCFAWG